MSAESFLIILPKIDCEKNKNLSKNRIVHPFKYCYYNELKFYIIKEERGIFMKYIRQFLIILLISFIKELLPLPVPASIYGLVLLFLALEFHIIPLEAVKETGKFLIEIMPILFVPAGVGLIESWDALRPIFVPVLAIMVISTVVVMAVSGRVTQSVMRHTKGREQL